jgi:hypothetical protein
MRRILLTSAAVAALLAGPTLALAQSPPEPRQSPGASSESTPSPKGNAREDRDKGQKSNSSSNRSDDGKAADRQEHRGAKSDQAQKSDQGKSQENRSNAAQKSGTSDAAQQSGTSDSERSKGAQTQPSGQKGQSKQGSSSPNSASSPNTERPTTGQSSSDQPTKGDRMNRDNASQQGQNRTEPNRSRTDQGRAEQGQSRTGTSSGTTGQSDRAGRSQDTRSQESRSSVSVKPEVQSKFSETIERRNIKTTTSVNVNVSVGRTLPRSVTVYDVPADIVSINPEFRGKKFTVVRDEIVIVEPRTQKVVSVIPRSGRATTGTTTSTRESSSRVQLAPEKRRVIRETVLKEQSAPRCEDVQVTVGSEVSSGIRFTPFPELVTREVPEVRSYQYCIKGDDVVLVDPGEHRIIDLID